MNLECFNILIFTTCEEHFTNKFLYEANLQKDPVSISMVKLQFLSRDKRTEGFNEVM